MALNASGDNSGMLILRDPASVAANPASVTTDNDGSSGSNNSGMTLDRPLANWVVPLTETEYLCFYDATTWPVAERSPTRLPDGCAAADRADQRHAADGQRRRRQPDRGRSVHRDARDLGLLEQTPSPTSGSAAQGKSATAIPSAPGTSYTATATDVGSSLRVEVTDRLAGRRNGNLDQQRRRLDQRPRLRRRKEPGKAAAGAPVQVCKLKGTPCRSTVTDGNGFYRVQVPVAGDYRVTAFPPAGSNAASKTRETITRVKAETEKTGQDVVLPLPKPPPPSVEFTGAGVRGDDRGRRAGRPLAGTVHDP